MQRQGFLVSKEAVQKIWLDNHKNIKEIHSLLTHQELDKTIRSLNLTEFEALAETDKKKIYEFINGTNSCPACREGLTVCLQKLDPELKSVARSELLRKPVTWEPFIKSSTILLEEHMREFVELSLAWKEQVELPAPEVELKAVIPLNTINMHNLFAVNVQNPLTTIIEEDEEKENSEDSLKQADTVPVPQAESPRSVKDNSTQIASFQPGR